MPSAPDHDEETESVDVDGMVSIISVIFFHQKYTRIQSTSIPYTNLTITTWAMRKASMMWLMGLLFQDNVPPQLM